MAPASNSVIVGVDPGNKGAFAGIDQLTGALLWVHDMPTMASHKAKGNAREVSPALVAQLLAGETGIVAIVIEQVGYLGNSNGGIALFKLGQAHGIVLGVAAAMQLPSVHVSPVSWKKAIGLTSDKERSRKMALDVWPSQGHYFARKMDDGRAEAALLAKWYLDRGVGR
jgi:Holliday junction resolvasome RuvABC endonuclease subunit